MSKSKATGFFCVRMAERSKAPDSRFNPFPRNEVSGLQMEAWVQIPLLTSVFKRGIQKRLNACFQHVEAMVEADPSNLHIGE